MVAHAVDGAYASITLENLGCQVDEGGLQMLAEMVTGERVSHQGWYDATPTGMLTALHRRVARAGYSVSVRRTVERSRVSRDGYPFTERKQLSVDQDLATDLIIWTYGGCETVVLVAGDGDYYSTAEKLVQLGVTLYVVASKRSISPYLAAEARAVLYIEDYLDLIGRPFNTAG